MQALCGGRLNGFFSPTSVVGVVLLLISSGVIIILVAVDLIFSPVVLPIDCYHLCDQPPTLILKLSYHSLRSFHGGRVRDVVYLIPVVLLMLLVVLIMSIM